MDKIVGKYILTRLKKDRTFKSIVDEFLNKAEKCIGNSIDLSYLREIAFYYNDIKLLSSNDKQEEAFENTVKKYGISLENTILINDLKSLTLYDKITIEENKYIFVKLDAFLLIACIFCSMIEDLDNIKAEKCKTLLSSKSTKNIDFVAPRIETLNKSLELIDYDDSVESHKKIYDFFKNKPLECNAVLNIINNIPQSAIKEKNIVDFKAIQRVPNILECSTINLTKDKIIDSIAIFAFIIYQKNSYINLCIKQFKEISKSKVANVVNTFLCNLFEDRKINYTYKHVNKQFQHLTYFKDYVIPIFEFRNSRNFKPNPIHEIMQQKAILDILKS